VSWSPFQTLGDAYAAGAALARRQWGHGDWHPSNLTWSSAAGSAVTEHLRRRFGRRRD
jgi:hypothetical protein